MAEFDAKYVKCPYYIEGNHTYQLKMNQIRCEGIIKNTTISLIFDTKQKEKEHRERYCYQVQECNKCPIHQMLDRKYGEI